MSNTILQRSPEPPARSNFWLQLVLFATILCVFERVYRGSLLNGQLHDEGVLRAKLIDYAKRPSDIVFTGDSRIYHGIVPHVVSDTVLKETGLHVDTYNLGIPFGHTPMYLMEVHRILREQKIPRVVVIALSPVVFSSNSEVLPSHELLSSSVLETDLCPLLRAAPNLEERAQDVFIAYSRLIAYRPNVLAALEEGSARRSVTAAIGNRGWVDLGASLGSSVQAIRGRSRAKGYEMPLSKAKSRLSTSATPYLVETARLLRNAKSKLVFIGAPQASQLNVNHGPDSIYADYVAHVEALAQSLGTTFTNLNDCPALKNEDFVDGDHLSTTGAATFSRFVTENVVIPALGT